jgi:asparagine synthase (glutamine-hydrolysing)
MTIQAGVWHFDGKPVSRESLAKISSLTTEYGADGESLHLDGNIGMLYRPFHTTPESSLERQPFVFDRGTVMLWDGRLDNRDELVAQLEHLLTTDKTDVAIVAAAFEQWGTRCFSKILGDWAVSIWKPSEQELILARDYIGTRRLFYYPTKRSVLWCSLLDPLVFCGDRFHLCDEFFAGYLSVMPAADLTPYREIHSVPPGTFVRIGKGKTAVHDFWCFNPAGKIRYKTDNDYEEHFREVFREAVQCRLRTSHPVLADLSGGLDSSSIVCMADYIRNKQATATACIDTFSFFDPDEPDEEDIRYFTRVEEFRGRTGHHAELKGLGDSFKLDSPTLTAVPGLGPRQELTQAKSALIRRENYRVLLSGNGGDYVLGQGLDPRIAVGDALVRFRLLALIKQLMEWSLATRRPAIHLLGGAFALMMPRAARIWLTGANRNPAWINATFARRYAVGDRILPGTEGDPWWLPTTREKYQTLMRLRGEMTHYVIPHKEMRYPYLDKRLVEFLFSIPANQLFRDGQRRSIMRRALAGIVPAEVLSRQTKSGTGRCVIATLHKHTNEIVALLTNPVSVRSGYLDQSSFKAALSKLQQGRPSSYLGPLLQAISLEVWLRDITTRGILSASEPERTWDQYRNTRQADCMSRVRQSNNGILTTHNLCVVGM